jgi:hypothetical protein
MDSHALMLIEMVALLRDLLMLALCDSVFAKGAGRRRTHGVVQGHYAFLVILVQCRPIVLLYNLQVKFVSTGATLRPMQLLVAMEVMRLGKNMQVAPSLTNHRSGAEQVVEEQEVFSVVFRNHTYARECLALCYRPCYS